MTGHFTKIPTAPEFYHIVTICTKCLPQMSDPSQPNDEGITALHNGICGGHYNVVDFLVRSGANVSAPDSHGW